METKIASYQEEGIRLQLLKISDYSTQMGIYYQIRKNRKVICRFKWERPAKQKFNALIQQELLKQKWIYENKPSRKHLSIVHSK